MFSSFPKSLFYGSQSGYQSRLIREGFACHIWLTDHREIGTWIAAVVIHSARFELLSPARTLQERDEE